MLNVQRSLSSDTAGSLLVRLEAPANLWGELLTCLPELEVLARRCLNAADPGLSGFGTPLPTLVLSGRPNQGAYSSTSPCNPAEDELRLQTAVQAWQP